MQHKCTSLTTALVVLSLAGGLAPAHAQPLHHEWGKRIGSTSTDMGYGIAVDGKGNTYTAASFSKTVDFNPGPGIYNMTALGSSGAAIVKLDAAGDFVWAKQFEGKGTSGIFSLALDAAGNIYTTGLFVDTVDFDPGPGNFFLDGGSNGDIFVAKLDSTGDLVWAARMGGSQYDQGSSIAVDAEGYAYVAGWFNDTADFDPGPGTRGFRAAGAADIFVLKLDPAGNLVWVHPFGSDVDDNGLGITLDAQRNVYFTGFFKKTVDFNPGTAPADTFNLTTGGTSGAFICKLDSAGGFKWAKAFSGGPSSQGVGNAITLDAENHVYTTGYFVGTVDFNPGSVQFTSVSNNYDVFVAKLDTNGSYMWAGQIKSAGRDEGKSIATDAEGSVYVTGYFSDSADFDPGAGSYKLGTTSMWFDWDVFISKLTPQGDFVWAKQIGTVSYDGGGGIAVGDGGTIYTTGYFTGNVDFDPGPDTARLISGGNEDIFILKWDQCINTSPVLTERACGSYTLDGHVYTASGTYTQTVYSGCDTSNVTLHLTVDTLGAAIAVNGYELSTTQPYDHYQWLRNDTAVPGATSRSYTVTSNAGYRVAVGNATGCTDTSDIYTVSNVRVDDRSVPAQAVRIYPNPARDMVYIDAPAAVNITLAGIEGKTILQERQASAFSIRDLPDGVYLLRVTGADGRLIKVEKLVKQNR